VLVAVVAVSGVLGGCAAGSADTSSADASTPQSVGSPTPCAEFVGVTSDGPDYEGWWSSSPAAADGSILTDPADWPGKMRDHLRTAVVDLEAKEVLSTWDRVSCGAIVDPPVVAADLTLPPELANAQVVVIDVDSGEVVEVLVEKD